MKFRNTNLALAFAVAALAVSPLIAAGCTIEESDDTPAEEQGGSAGQAGKGGSTGKGGTSNGGSAQGGSSNGGSSNGGSSNGGSSNGGSSNGGSSNGGTSNGGAAGEGGAANGGAAGEGGSANGGAAGEGGAAGAAGAAGGSPMQLTLLHSDDMESRLVNLGTGYEDFGGVARFATVVKNLKTEAAADPGGGVKPGSVLLGAGDAFLPGPEFDASLKKGTPYYDAMALDAIGYDAFTLGNHDFDFGTPTLKSFIESFTTTSPKFLSANIDFSGDTNLQPLVTSGRIAKRTVVTTNGEQVGIVGLTTKDLAILSNMGGVTVSAELATAVQTEVDALETSGVNKIILLSHLQSVENDKALVPLLHGVDVVVAGGGHEFLANAGTPIVKDDKIDATKYPYPLKVNDKDGVSTPIVTTNGLYKYVGRLIATFDKDGKITSIDTKSGPVRVTGEAAATDKVDPDAQVQNFVVTPVTTHIAGLKANQVATTEVPLHGQKLEVRAKETNLGDLVADGMIREAEKLVPPTVPRVVIMNGGGIRNDSIIPVGPLTEYDTFSILPFSNFVTIVSDVTPQMLKQAFEHAVSMLPNPAGQFPQISGVWMVVNPAGTARVADANGNETTPGTRVTEIGVWDWWDGSDPKWVYRNGQFEATAPAKIEVVTINFMANGGDGFPFKSFPHTILATPYQQALKNYLMAPATELGCEGVVSASLYPETFTYENSRIWIETPTP